MNGGGPGLRGDPWLPEEQVGWRSSAKGRFFNTTGPCNPVEHYMLSPKQRLVGAMLDKYLTHNLYWVLHAPRQTGKSTFLLSWVREINASRSAIACYASVEVCQGETEVSLTNRAICQSIISSARLSLVPDAVPVIPDADPLTLVGEFLAQWARQVAPWPLVVLFDEVDVLQDQPMVSFLRQLRSGFAQRGPGRFPTCVALVGMRDLRDYLIKAKDGVPVNPGSPFNIKESSASLANFTREDVHALIGQHVAEKGQPFAAEAIDLIYEFSRGQPWLVNGLAKKCVWNLVPEETKAPVTVEHVRQAKELLIQERAVHLDSLAERLKDPQVRRVVQAILVGETDPELAEGDDFRLCLDLGLVTVEQGVPQIANPIYREVIPRVLTQGAQLAIPQPEFAWQKSDGTLDLAGLLREFQRFWRRHADAWEAKSDYLEAFPHLLLMAFLQRVLNGQGRIEREYAAGRGRVDLAVEWQGRWSVIEIKLVHPADGREGTIEEGLRQTARYRDAVGASEAYLVVFDRRPEARTRPWEERLTWEERPAPMGQGGPITVVGA
ncbi:MAG: Cell division protein FtsI [Peptidoglycan synthetase] [Candidatus Ozemobacter sibiricus]|uniref:Cell division protein FtsI [Peptidoglycan synthetase] n=1 Tax=Candidatus Ozemobacter sibiricus TaxID=2268124 RepID=A0A367Z558_9BACT|nr:MAG: Cell division protein FtsI [Peptidoglycan synthetase] [Candidatus Ozemobacter sibiricus]